MTHTLTATTNIINYLVVCTNRSHSIVQREYYHNKASIMTWNAAAANSWRRVAAGLQMVVQAAAAQTRDEVTLTATRVAQHGVEVAARTSSLFVLRTTTVLPRVPSSAEWPSADRGVLLSSKKNSNNPHVTSVEQDRSHHVEPYEERVSSQLNSEPISVPASREISTSQHSTASAPLLQTNDSFDHSCQHTLPDPHKSDDRGASASVVDATADLLSIAPKDQIPVPSSLNSLPQNIATENTASTNPIQQHDDELRSSIQEGRAVPSTRFGRALGFASLGLGLAWGTLAEGTSRLVQGGGTTTSSGHSLLLNDPNSDRLAATLCRMRGAALKMGQMLSIQDEALLPQPLMRALNKVRQGAEAMPKYQLQQQLEQQLGLQWRDRFVRFDALPFAAASIGQVHRASIVDRTTGTIRDVVVKVQYPGVARSIESDLNNLAMLVKLTGLAPKGLFIDNVIRVGQKELQVECDYLREKKNQMRIQALVRADPVLMENRFVVPDVMEDLTTEQVITRYVSSCRAA